jgi:hypothetical protein
MKTNPSPKAPVIKKDNHPKLIGATVLITFGLIIILNNFGLLPWTVLETISKLWPLILVAWGFKMLLK